MKKRHPFLEQLQRRAEQAKSSAISTGAKPIDEMDAEELEAELQSLRWERRKLEIEELAAKEQAMKSGTSSSTPRAFVPRRQSFLFKRRSRPQWK